MAFVSPFKRFRWFVPFVHSRSIDDDGSLFADNNNIWWWLFSSLPLCCISCGFLQFRALYYPRVFIFSPLLTMALYMFHVIVLMSVLYSYRDMPYQLMGAKAKFMIEVFLLTTAAALHHLLAFNYGYLSLLVGYTTYIYTVAHFSHASYDIGGLDVLFGVVIQVLAYTLNIGLLARAMALGFCFGLCLYRYVTYCAPHVPPHRKKELE